MSSFELIGEIKIQGQILASKYKSKKTGLTVVLGQVDGPVCNGYYVLATEAHDDDGLPHTLEHLIFLGSEKYPFKGVLDLLANRCLASGTNAWTDTDHTCYTMTTAGSDGFLTLMPIYLDHILYPILSDSGFMTEVHHVSGEGEDGGVVYCEMQGRENTGESRAHLQLLRAAYKNSGYSAETGGIMHNLRTSCNNEKVRKYHNNFYCPQNLTLIITGRIQPENIFEALQPIEDKILSKNLLSSFSRPWQAPIEPLNKSEDLKILFPSDEEDCGLIYIGYRGPNCVNNYTKLTACGILLRYLTDTSVSPLQREFVENQDPYASKVSYTVIENLESLLSFVFDNVPISKLDLVKDKLTEILQGFVTGNEAIDMTRMKSILDREILESLSNLESNPHDTVAYLVIGDIIYGNNQNDFKERLNTKTIFEYFLTLDENYWIELLQEYFIEGFSICVRAFPSIEEQNRMSKEEIDRIEKQRQVLGPQGLSNKAKELQKAMEKNEVSPPNEMLTEVPVPNVEKISFHDLQIYKCNQKKNISNVFNFDDISIYAELYDINTNFIYIIVTINTNNLEKELRSYLLLFLELLLESPIRQPNGNLIPYEEVVAALERDTISSSTTLGLEGTSFSAGPFSHAATLMLQIEPRKYDIGVNWIKDLLCATEFPADRIKSCASKMFNSVSQAKRKGNTVARDLLKAMYYQEDTNVQLGSMLRQQKFLGQILKYLESPEGTEKVKDNLNKIRNNLVQHQNIGLHIATNINKMNSIRLNLSDPWKQFLSASPTSTKTLTVIPDWQIMNLDTTVESDNQGTVVGLGSVESAFLFHGTPSINNFMDPDLPAVLLFLQYLTQLEGPLWRQIRGQGFAYGYNIVPRPHEGLLCLTLYRASNVIAAFKECKSIIELHLKDDFQWDQTLFESARSSLIFELIERERSVGNLVLQSILFSYKNVGHDYNQLLVKKVNNISTKQLTSVGKKYIAPLFSKAAKTAIVCHPDKVSEIANAFATMNINLKAVSSLEDSVLAN